MPEMIPPRKGLKPTVSRLHLLHAMSEAEKAWMAEVCRVFGEREAGLVRFQQRGAGEPGSQLHALYTAYLATRDSYISS